MGPRVEDTRVAEHTIRFPQKSLDGNLLLPTPPEADASLSLEL